LNVPRAGEQQRMAQNAKAAADPAALQVTAFIFSGAV
jgi:hypothetical protein